MMAQRVEAMKTNLPKYLISWLGEAICYWIFVIMCIDSKWGFNWWLGDRPWRFGIICIIYILKNVGFLVLVPIFYKKMKGLIDIKFPLVDLVYFGLQVIFWLVCTIYAFDREVTSEKIRDADWAKRYQKWTDEIYILPVVKVCIDFVLALVGVFLYPLSHCAQASGGIIFMDLQYLFISLFITGKVRWENYFTVFVWIYMGSIILMLASLCIICFVVMSIFKTKLNLTQYLLFTCISVMGILFFVWATLIGSKEYAKDNIYILLVCTILFTIYHGYQTFAVWKGIDLVPQS